MCITSARATLSNTLIYTGTAQKQGKDVHVLAYQNTADSSGPNSMILPFPTSEEMSEKNIIDTRPFKGFLKDIADASKVRTRSLGISKSFSAVAAGGAQVFDVGSYTVVLAEKASQIPAALSRVSERKRPEISTRFLIGFGKLYPDQPIALCCWDGHIKAEPLLWWYVPTNKDVLFAPTMDAHDGNAPDIEALVDTDHIISVGSSMTDKVGHHNRIVYKDSIPEDVRRLLPDHTYGVKLNHQAKNGDMFLDSNKLGRAMSYRDIPIITRGTQFTFGNREWEMTGWH